MAGQAQQVDVIGRNLAQRNTLLQYALDEWQAIFSNTYTSGTGTVINIPVKPVGFIKRFIVQIAATVSGSGGVTHTLTTLGASNFLSSVVLTDLNNNVRVQTTGWHLTAVASAKYRQPFGAAITSTDTPFGYSNAYNTTIAAPATITASAASSNVYVMYEVPVTYSDTDLRGGIYANVVNATMNLQLTVNPQLLAISTDADPVLAMYQSSTTTRATLPSFTVTVYQNFLDQVPMSPNGPILPLLDMSTAYLLNNTSVSGLVANQDNAIPYSNFRDFMSTTLIYNNAGTLNAGTDITDFSLQTANFTNLWKYTTPIASLMARQRLENDFPKGMYYFDHRNRPVSTIQYGNMQLNVKPSSVTSSASVFFVGYESLALMNQVTQAGSLYNT